MKKLEAALKTGKLITDLMLIVLLLCILALPITSLGLLQVKKSANEDVLSKQVIRRDVDPRTLPSSADLPEDTPDEFKDFNDFENYLLDVYSEDIPAGTEE